MRHARMLAPLALAAVLAASLTGFAPEAQAAAKRSAKTAAADQPASPRKAAA